jgi:hypothetical protein
MPEFDIFADNAKNQNLDYKIKKIESSNAPKNINSFPTIQISIDGKKHEYNGPRKANALQEEIENLLNKSGNQSGGNPPYPQGTFMTPAIGMPINPGIAAMGQPPLLNPSVLTSPTVIQNQPLLGAPGFVGSPMGLGMNGMMGNPGLMGTSMGLGMNGMMGNPGLVGVGFDDECNKCRKYKKKYHKYKKIAARLLEKYNELKKD